MTPIITFIFWQFISMIIEIISKNILAIYPKNNVLSKILEVNCSQQLINKNLKSIFAALGGNISLVSYVTFWSLLIFLRLCVTFRPNLADHMRAIVPQMDAGGHWFIRIICRWRRGSSGFPFVRGMVGLGFQPFAWKYHSCMHNWLANSFFINHTWQLF